MPKGIGTGLFTPYNSTVNIALTDPSGYALLITSNGAPGSTATDADVFAPGCVCIRTDSVSLYQNTGTAASPTWTLNSATAGATGSTGPAGTTGATGPQGATGATGPGA